MGKVQSSEVPVGLISSIEIKVDNGDILDFMQKRRQLKINSAK